MFLAFLALWKALASHSSSCGGEIHEFRVHCNSFSLTPACLGLAPEAALSLWCWAVHNQRVPLAGSSLSSKHCSCHLGQGGSMWPVPAKSISVLKVERVFLHLAVQQNHKNVPLLCLAMTVCSQQCVRARGWWGIPPGHHAGNNPWEEG